MRMVSKIMLMISFIQVAVLSGTAGADLGLPVSGLVTSRVGLRLDPFGSGKLI